MEETVISLDRQGVRREPDFGQSGSRREDGGAVELVAESKTVGPLTLVRSRFDGTASVRSAGPTLPDGAGETSVLWFVKYGRVRRTASGRDTVILPGGFAVTGAQQPARVECHADADRVFEALHVLVPTPVLSGYLQREIGAGLFFDWRRSELEIAENVLTDLFEEEGELAESAATLLVETALTLIGAAARGEDAPLGQTIIARRQDDLLRYIEVHLSNPQLAPAMAARGCGISPRYLSTLLQMKGTSFSEVVWNLRLEKACAFLASEALQEMSIAEIAYSLGFKSPAHFSRMFKRVLKVSPREYRNAHGRRARDRTPPMERLPGAVGAGAAAGLLQ